MSNSFTTYEHKTDIQRSMIESVLQTAGSFLFESRCIYGGFPGDSPKSCAEGFILPCNSREYFHADALK